MAVVVLFSVRLGAGGFFTLPGAIKKFDYFLKGRKEIIYLMMLSTHFMVVSEWVIMEFNVAAGIFLPFATIMVISCQTCGKEPLSKK